MSASCELHGVKITHTGPGPYIARSASDRDTEWPLWIVVDQVGFNGIAVEERMTKLFNRALAMEIADKLNGASS